MKMFNLAILMNFHLRFKGAIFFIFFLWQGKELNYMQCMRFNLNIYKINYACNYLHDVKMCNKSKPLFYFFKKILQRAIKISKIGYAIYSKEMQYVQQGIIEIQINPFRQHNFEYSKWLESLPDLTDLIIELEPRISSWIKMADRGSNDGDGLADCIGRWRW